MSVTVTFPRYDVGRRAYVTWRPVPVQIAITGEPNRQDPLRVTVSDDRPTQPAAGRGRLLFADHLTHAGRTSTTVDLPADGTAVTVWVGGEFPAASTAYGDVAVRVAGPQNQPLATHPTMVRIRKNANVLTTTERARFLAALAKLNGAGTGRFADFREMHRSGAPSVEAHGAAAFLAWHRAYLLDFERELQSIDGEVTVPYWRFDRAAPNLFVPAFLGTGTASGQLQFTPGNPLVSWVTDNTPGIQRGRGVGPQTVPFVRTEQQTIALSVPPNANYAAFRVLEGDPHGTAHTSHGTGWITSIGTAAKDPLFFLLHANVDRLWAKWQWVTQLQDPRSVAAFDGASTAPGHRLNDAMWPWCGPLAAPRPTTAPGGGMQPSPMTPVPGASPKVRDTIDYLGTVGPEPLGFAYDDVPFQLPGGRR